MILEGAALCVVASSGVAAWWNKRRDRRRRSQVRELLAVHIEDARMLEEGDFFGDFNAATSEAAWGGA
jgi:hypothetical protein